MKPHRAKGRSLLVALAACCTILVLCLSVGGNARSTDEVTPEVTLEEIGVAPAPVSAQKKAQEGDDEGVRKADHGDAGKAKGKTAEGNQSDVILTDAPTSDAASTVSQGADD